MHWRMHVVNAVLLAALFGVSLLVWPELPGRIPGHFSAGGEVTRWEPSSVLRWLLLPIIALAMVVMSYVLAAVLPRRPGIFNHPDKEAFLALPPARRAPVIARMRTFLYGMSASLIVVFGVVQWARYRTALGGDSDLPIALVLVISAMSGPIGLGLWFPPISQEVRDQTRQAEEERAAAGAVEEEDP